MSQFKRVEIITPENGAMFGTRILIDGIEQHGVYEANLHMLANSVVRLEMKRYVSASVKGEADIVDQQMCYSCADKRREKSDVSRSMEAFSRWWKITSGLQGEGWMDAWEMLESREKAGWLAVAQGEPK